MQLQQSVLPLHLPSLPPEQFYQLAFVGPYYLPASGSQARLVDLHFVRKTAGDGFQRVIGLPETCSIAVDEAFTARVGSLWTAQGVCVSDEVSIQVTAADLSPAAPASIPLFPVTHTCVLQTGSTQLAQLHEVLDLTHLPSSVLSTQPTAWVLLHEQEGIRYVLPCTELLRTFFYVDGPPLTDFFFSHVPLTHVCQVVEPPSPANGHTVRVAVVTDAFTTAQVCLLAEMSLSPWLLAIGQRAHSFWLQQARDTGIHFPIEFLPPRPVQLFVNGFAFQHQGIPHFWVCTIRQHAGLWSFQGLSCTWEIDHRSAQHARSAGQPRTGGALPGLAPGAIVSPLDSTRQGSQNVDTLTLALPGQPTYPPVTIQPKLEQDARSPGRRPRFPVVPEFLTQRGGAGGDGGVKPRKVQGKDTVILSLPAFFCEVVALLEKQPQLTVTILTLNNKRHLYGATVSVFPTWWQDALDSFFVNGLPRQLGIAHIHYMGGHFYFLQLQGGGRAVLLYRHDLRLLSDGNLNYLLKYLAEANFNWESLKKNQAYQQNLTRSFGSPLCIHLRNHLRHEPAQVTARRCMEDMDRAYS